MSAASEWFAAESKREKERPTERRAELAEVGRMARARLQRMPLDLALYCRLVVEDAIRAGVKNG